MYDQTTVFIFFALYTINIRRSEAWVPTELV